MPQSFKRVHTLRGLAPKFCATLMSCMLPKLRSVKEGSSNQARWTFAKGALRTTAETRNLLDKHHPDHPVTVGPVQKTAPHPSESLLDTTGPQMVSPCFARLG